MTCEGVTHGYIDTPGIMYVVAWQSAEGTRYDVLQQIVVSYGTYPGYAGVWPIYSERIERGLTAEEVSDVINAHSNGV